MKVTLESTSHMATLDGVRGRIWKGSTDKGIACEAFIARLAVLHDLDTSEFAAALTEVASPSRVQSETPVDPELEHRWLAYAARHGEIPLDIRADAVIWYAVLAGLHLALTKAEYRSGHAGAIARAFMRQTIARLAEDDAEGGAILNEMFGDVL